MNNSALTPRMALVAKARKHFVAIAASGAILTGGLTAYVASDHANATTPTPPGDSSTGTTSSNDSPDSSSTGLTTGNQQGPSDGQSNAS